MGAEQEATITKASPVAVEHAAKVAGEPASLPKVMIAEDNPVVRKGLQNFLVKWGYEPVETSGGKEAWQKLRDDPSIRLAILDWNLPGLTGMQVCLQLRRKRPAPYVYIIIFSSRASTEEQVVALEHGADDYLVKPAKPSLLKARLGVGRRIVEQALALR
ncbi:MAG: response regulator transcription factor [Desulfobulbaceae bacterium]|nr:MAG: response regulator transcription factor [Desulfobulbaceae bacterium]